MNKERIYTLALKLALNPLATRSDIDYLVDTHTRCSQMQSDLDAYRRQLKNRDTLFHMNELDFQKHLLKRLGYCSEDEAMTRKGRIACKIFTGDELLLTELLLDGVFNGLTPVQIASVLSCSVVERSVIKQHITPVGSDLERVLQTVHAKARYLARAAAESRASCPRSLAVESDGIKNLNATQSGYMNYCTGRLANEQTYVGRFSGELMEVVRRWAEKSSFAELCEITSAYEGGLIRCMRRLNELLREMSAAASVAGDTKLERKFMKASKLIYRDIVAATSLYWWHEHTV
ncbi:unnamed protein product [Dicrocoelium dendriticum]|nr:unnamed protein product [Dicrocoelium dendriticum]